MFGLALLPTHYALMREAHMLMAALEQFWTRAEVTKEAAHVAPILAWLPIDEVFGDGVPVATLVSSCVVTPARRLLERSKQATLAIRETRAAAQMLGSELQQQL